MKKKSGRTQEMAKLRQCAELRLPVHLETATDWLMTNEKKLLHELQVHQIELEMQNEALQRALVTADEARSEAELAQERYAELFDFAPIAYFSIDNDGVIRKSNIRGRNLLGITQSKTVGQDFIQYVSFKNRPFLSSFLNKYFRVMPYRTVR
jgi:PAS domain-containing protein